MAFRALNTERKTNKILHIEQKYKLEKTEKIRF